MGEAVTALGVELGRTPLFLVCMPLEMARNAARVDIIDMLEQVLEGGG